MIVLRLGDIAHRNGTQGRTNRGGGLSWGGCWLEGLLVRRVAHRDRTWRRSQWCRGLLLTVDSLDPWRVVI